MKLKELAETLGLSQTTVSRALNDYPEVSEATRIRVKQAAIHYNYRANASAKGLATGRSMTIGHVISSSSQYEMVNPIFGDFLAGASTIYSQHGYDLLISRAEDGDEAQAYRKLVSQGLVDGIVIQGPRNNEPRIRLLQELGIPFVVHGRASDMDGDYAWVDVNNRSAFRRATNFLLDLGHRRVALINGSEKLDFAQRRRQGYLDAFDAKGIAIDLALMCSDEMTEVYGHHAARDMLTMDDPPSAFVVSSLISAFGVRRALEEAGLQIGRDASVVSYDDDLSYLKNGQDVPIFTATRSSVRDAGEYVAQLLINIINDPSAQKQSQLLEAELIVGRSTAPMSC